MRLAVLAVVAALTLTACGDDTTAPAEMAAPDLGACRVLSPEDVAQPANSSPSVPCSESHTAETYAVGELPSDFDDVDYGDEQLGAWAYQKCTGSFRDFLGADESLVMRTVVSWAWFRPTQEAWDDGARWYRCDVVGGGEQSKESVRMGEGATDVVGSASRAIFEAAQAVIPGGVNSATRAVGAPYAFTRAEGARMWDAEKDAKKPEILPAHRG